MQRISGAGAVVTGASSGIGFALAQALAEAGARVVMADIDAAGLDAARTRLAPSGTIHTIHLDTRSERSWTVAAGRAAELVGKVHIFCCNAGIAAGVGLIEERTVEDLDAVWQVNARGMFLGLKAFLPAMKAHGEEGHIVVTSSVMGLFAMPRTAVYAMTKYAALALAETLYLELRGTPLGASVLCPGAVNTSLLSNVGRYLESQADNSRNRGSAGLLAHGVAPDAVARCVLDAISKRKFYVITHPEYRPLIEDRAKMILDSCGQSASPGHRDDLSMYSVYSGASPADLNADLG